MAGKKGGIQVRLLHQLPIIFIMTNKNLQSRPLPKLQTVFLFNGSKSLHEVLQFLTTNQMVLRDKLYQRPRRTPNPPTSFTKNSRFYRFLKSNWNKKDTKTLLFHPWNEDLKCRVDSSRILVSLQKLIILAPQTLWKKLNLSKWQTWFRVVMKTSCTKTWTDNNLTWL